MEHAKQSSSIASPTEPLLAIKLIPSVVIILLSIIAWQFTPPSGLSLPAYHTAIIFIATIAAIVANVLPTGAVAIISVSVYAVLHAGGETSAKAAIMAATSNFNNVLIWLIVIAFMIARAFAKTGLGRRIALVLLRYFGQSSLRIAYCLGVADFLIAPATPSNTARSAIVSPIADSLAKTINKDDSKLGKYLISSVSAMNDASAVGFQTGFAGNLALVGIAASVANINMTFTHWAMYLLIPALVLLITIPFILYKFINPETKQTPEAPEFARAELKKMGKVTQAEWKLIAVFIALIIMWVGGKALSLHSTTAAFIGLSALLVLGVLNWNDVKAERGAWDTLIWFAVLMGMASQLKTLGFTGWVGHGVSDMISSSMGNAGPTLILLVMMGFYLLTAYFFASGTAKVVALGPVIIGSLMVLGVNPLIAILAVAGITNIGCNLTTYSHARNPLLMGYQYHNDKEWMKIGLVISIGGAIIFMTTGLIWWSVLGLM
ncbi:MULTISPECIES: DASS family sodium-coupled anion symporter [unclassified Photobacterium]|uniref:DASS family sodium-coupled anion symporter n=1 Tax=unclassified Photobacterium TaxID=2628852 RepID=UPI001EE06205|nr:MULTISPECIES: DASS family sodium-coupled anion symporter [unclassified Photobacterium]MCG3862622.1 DASS family sodium-coupled anion symporter [Photobacterium sp. Ph6]MCG3874153.1 DASS family sodium-coupled anion symporter [Photobacterium sp. Ph5]